ncbi:MAG TPA: class I SAM-dependent methyltransferase [Acidimicrobiales bacterium]
MNRCKVCDGPTEVTHKGLVLGRYEVTYSMCSVCEYWSTEEPYWLDEAYSDAIDSTDTGLVQRNLRLARQVGAMLPRLYPDGPYVDWAGGCGMFVRLMRDAGFDFYWQDRYAANLLARGFGWDGRGDGRKATVVTAFEVLEHAPDPLAFFREMIEGTGADAFFFTETLHPGPPVDPEWWYLAPVTGQHISFYSSKTLETLARQLGLHLRSWDTLHLMTRRPVDALAYRRAVTSAQLASVLSRVPGLAVRTPPTLTWADNLDLIQRRDSSSSEPSE